MPSFGSFGGWTNEMREQMHPQPNMVDGRQMGAAKRQTGPDFSPHKMERRSARTWNLTGQPIGDMPCDGEIDIPEGWRSIQGIENYDLHVGDTIIVNKDVAEKLHLCALPWSKGNICVIVPEDLPSTEPTNPQEHGRVSGGG